MTWSWKENTSPCFPKCEMCIENARKVCILGKKISYFIICKIKYIWDFWRFLFLASLPTFFFPISKCPETEKDFVGLLYYIKCCFRFCTPMPYPLPPSLNLFSLCTWALTWFPSLNSGRHFPPLKQTNWVFFENFTFLIQDRRCSLLVLI